MAPCQQSTGDGLRFCLDITLFPWHFSEFSAELHTNYSIYLLTDGHTTEIQM